MKFPDRVAITEVGPRDGLQNESRAIPLAQKIALVDALSETGLTRIEAASFVSPKAIPQMANAAEVMAGIRHRAGVTYIGSNAKARRELGYNPRPLEEGLAETLRHEMTLLGMNT